MKNKFLIAFFLISIQNTLLAEDILIGVQKYNFK